MTDLSWLKDCPEGERPEWWEWIQSCPPRSATERDWSAPTMGPQVAAMAELLGWTPMPWQRFVLDVAYEFDWQVTSIRGEKHRVPMFRYRTVLGSVPRQAGKTTLGLPVKIHRCLALPGIGPAPYGGPQNVAYTAQDRSRAFKKFSTEHVPRVKACKALDGLFETRMTTGSERIQFTNGSRFAIESSTEQAGHGDTLDLAFLDEAFSIPDGRLEAAATPAMITRPLAQLWIWSTHGTDKAVWFKGKCDRARRRTLAEQRAAREAFFEWAAPTEGDPQLDDLTIWSKFHPACGFTQTPESLTAAALSMEDPLDAKRAFFNWHRSGDDFEAAIPMVAWRTAADEGSSIESKLRFALDVTPSRSHTALAVAGLRQDEAYHGEVIDHRPGTDWVVARCVELSVRWDEMRWHLDPAGPAGSLIRGLESAGLEVVETTARSLAQSCGLLFDLVTSTPPRFFHRGQLALDTALESAEKRDLADAWAWKRSSADADISPLVAVTIALGAANTPEPEKTVKPVFAYF